ncbi:MAG TPA: gluconate 2-dehydrogenase subunit 3 family protein [Gaiellaceae bacterium]
MTFFRGADHLPSRGPWDPRRLPRQRRGKTPQMHGRYPDHDVLSQVDHWDEVTRRVVLDRVENVPAIRFFTAAEARALRAFCDCITAQDEEPRIPVLEYVDEKLYENRGDGYQYFDMPSDRETWRTVARGLDEEARKLGRESFALLTEHEQHVLCHSFNQGELFGGAWATFNVSRAWSIVVRYICEAFYAHPWSWNEIGFGGPAYPRGYAAFGSPKLGEEEHWEAKEAVDVDPVRDTRAKGLD